MKTRFSYVSNSSSSSFLLKESNATKNLTSKDWNEMIVSLFNDYENRLDEHLRIEKEFETCPEDFLRLSLDDYLDLVIDILERLRPGLYIERVAGEVPPRFVNETQWGLIRNFQILHLLDDRLSARDTWQGRLFRHQFSFKPATSSSVSPVASLMD